MDILFSRALAHFSAAYDHLNLRSAAAAVHVTQPAISKSISKLEDHIGMPLFERTSKGVRPTQLAHMLRRHAQNIVNEARFVGTEIAALKGGSGGQVRMGVGPAWSLTVLPYVVSRFQQRFSSIDIEVKTGVTDQLMPLLHEGEIDFWLGSLHDIEETDEIVTQRAGWSDMAVFVSTHHPLTQLGAVEASHLAPYNWATFSNDVRGLAYLRSYFKAHGLPEPRVALKVTSLVTMLAAAASSQLLVFCADTLQSEAISRGLVRISLPEHIWGFHIGMAYRKSTADLATTRYVRSLIDESGQTGQLE